MRWPAVLGALLALALASCSEPADEPDSNDAGPASNKAESPQAVHPMSDEEIGPWEAFRLAGADPVEHYLSLPDMTQSASVVVRATVASIEPGPIYGDVEGGEAVQLISATLQVSSVLAGGTDLDPIVVELGPVELESVSDAYQALVGDEGIFFLRRKGEAVPRFQTTFNEQEYSRGVFLVVSSQGLLINDGGLVWAALWGEGEIEPEGFRFPAELNGMDFEEIAETVEGEGEDEPDEDG